MDELIGHIAANNSIEEATASKAVGLILQFLLRDGPTGKVQGMVDALPGADDLIASSPALSRGGIMGVFNDLTNIGLGMGEVQGVAGDFVAYAREKVGAETVDEVVASIPGLSQFV